MILSSTPPDETPRLARNLAAGGFQGRIVLWEEGPPPAPPFERYAAPEQAGSGLDLALCDLDLDQLTQSLPGLAAAGVKAVVAYTPAPPGRAWREPLRAAAKAAGVRLVGPGSWGVANTAIGLEAALERPSLRPGGLALLSRSGSICGYCLAEGQRRGLGWSLVLDLGAEADLSQDEVLEYMAGHYQAKALLVHLGRVRRPAAFMSAAQAAARLKPVVVLKTGEYADTPPCPASRSLAGPPPEAAWEAALTRAGVLCVDSLDKLLTLGELAGRQHLCQGPRLLVIAASAGAGRLAQDACRRHGLTPVLLDEPSRQILTALGCREPGESGLVLLGPEVDQDTWQKVAAHCLREADTDAVLAVLTPCACGEPAVMAEVFRQASRGVKGPRRVLAMAAWPGAALGEASALVNDPLALFTTPEKAMEAYAGLWRHSEIMRLAKEIPPRPLGRAHLDRDGALRLLTEAMGRETASLSLPERLELLKAYHLPVLPLRRVSSPEELGRAGEAWGYPIRLLLSPKVLPDGDPLPELEARLEDASQVEAKWRDLHQQAARRGKGVGAVWVQPWPRTAEACLAMGWRRHPELGPLLLFGEGGERPGAVRERSWGLPPLNRALARAMMEPTQVFASVTGEQGPERVWPSMLEEVLVNLSRMAQDLPQIVNLDINPVVLADRVAWFADARLELAPAIGPALPHLVVSPYPEEHEARSVCRDGLEVLLRPIRFEDADLVQEFFDRLSTESIYHRFFQDLPGLSPQMLLHLTQIDYGREIALAAVSTHGPREKVLGLCSLAQRPGSQWAEFAVLVGDRWQRRGIGKLLMRHLLELARAKGQRRILGVVLRGNRAMLQLGRSVGFHTDNPQDGLVELHLTMDPAAGLGSESQARPDAPQGTPSGGVVKN